MRGAAGGVTVVECLPSMHEYKALCLIPKKEKERLRESQLTCLNRHITKESSSNLNVATRQYLSKEIESNQQERVFLLLFWIREVLPSGLWLNVLTQQPKIGKQCSCWCCPKWLIHFNRRPTLPICACWVSPWHKRQRWKRSIFFYYSVLSLILDRSDTGWLASKAPTSPIRFSEASLAKSSVGKLDSLSHTCLARLPYNC